MATRQNKGQVFDIHANTKYKWTQDKSNDSVPFIKLIEYKNETDTKVQEMLYLKKANDIYGNQKDLDKEVNAGSFDDVYKNLYRVTPTGNSFKLPYIKSEGYTLDTRYSQIDPKASTFGNGIQQLWNNINNFQYKLGDEWDSVQGLLEDENTILSETRARRQGTQLAKQSVKAYSGSNFGEYSTVFNLLNEDDEKAEAHLNFIQTILKNNTPAFISVMAIKVPYVYSIDISGLYKIPLGFISKFSARPKGNVILKDGAYVPDAWEISMNFNSLIPISKQLLEKGFDKETTASEDIQNAFVTTSNYQGGS